MKYLITNLEKFIKDPSSNIYIIGVPGSGKTTLSRILSRELKLQVVSSDSLGGLLEASSKEDYVRKYKDILTSIISSQSKTIIEGVGIARLGSEWLTEQTSIVILKPIWQTLPGFIKAKRHMGYSYPYLIYHGIKLNLKWHIRINKLVKELPINTENFGAKHITSLDELFTHINLSAN